MNRRGSCVLEPTWEQIHMDNWVEKETDYKAQTSGWSRKTPHGTIDIELVIMGNHILQMLVSHKHVDKRYTLIEECPSGNANWAGEWNKPYLKRHVSATEMNLRVVGTRVVFNEMITAINWREDVRKSRQTASLLLLRSVRSAEASTEN